MTFQPVKTLEKWALSFPNESSPLPLMKHHKSLIFLRKTRYYLRISQKNGFSLYIRFVFSENFARINISFYSPMQKIILYSQIDCEKIAEKVIIALQNPSKVLKEKLLRYLLKPQWCLLGSKLKIREKINEKRGFFNKKRGKSDEKINDEKSHEKISEKYKEITGDCKENSQFYLMQKFEKIGKIYIIITVFRDKITGFFMLKIELKPANSKTKTYDIYVKNHDFFLFFDEIQKKIEENSSFFVFLKHFLLPKIHFHRDFLYKKPVFSLNSGSFLHNTGFFLGKSHFLKEKYKKSRVIYQQSKKFVKNFAIITVIKQESLDFWNILISFTRNSRSFVSNFYKSDLLKMKASFLQEIFSKELDDLKGEFLSKNTKKYHEFHLIYSGENGLNSSKKEDFSNENLRKDFFDFCEIKVIFFLFY